MADGVPTSLLAALQSTYYQPTDTYAGIGAQAVAGAIPALNNPYASTTQNLGSTVGAGLLAGLLAGYGRYSAAQDNAALQPQITALMSAPAAERQKYLETDPRLSPLVGALTARDFEAAAETKKAEEAKQRDVRYAPQIIEAEMRARQPLEQQALVRENLTKDSMAQGIAPLNGQAVPYSDLGLKTPQELKIEEIKAGEAAKLQAEADSYGYNPKKELEVEKLRKEFSSLPEVKNFAIVEKTASIVDKTLQDFNSVSDLELTRYAILAIEPGMAVREGEQAAVGNSQAIPESWKGQIQKALSGESTLGPDVREGLKNLMIRAYEGHKLGYDRAFNFYQNEAKQKGIDPARVSYIGAASPSEKVLGGQSAGPIQTRTLADGTQVRVQQVGPGQWVEVE